MFHIPAAPSLGQPLNLQIMTRENELRLLALQWVFVLEGWGDYFRHLHTARRNLENRLRTQSKHPEAWTPKECADFITQIIEDGSQNTIHRSQAGIGAGTFRNVEGSPILQGEDGRQC